jgi:exopolysaccharide production protein ExoQ
MSTNSVILEDRSLVVSAVGGLPCAIGFYFAFRLFFVVLAVRIFGATPQTGTEINLVLNFFLLLVTAFGCLGTVRYSFVKMARLSDVRWVLFFLALSCCSLTWSSTASLSISIGYWCALAADVAIVMLLFRAEPITAITTRLMKGFIWGACLGAAVAWILPVQSDLRLGDEELLGPNNIGYLCALALFFTQYLMKRKSGSWGLAAFLLGVTLLRCLSKTTIVAFLAGEAFLLIRDKSMKRRAKIYLTLSAGLVVAAFSTLLVSYFAIYTNLGNQSETLSGRFGIWAYILAEAIQQPWVGHGFNSVWKVIPPFGSDQFEAAHAHNEILQQFYAYGVVGVVIFFGIYRSIYRHVRQLAVGSSRTFFLALLILVFVRGIADTERFDLSLPLWVIVMISLQIEQEIVASSSARANSVRIVI